MSLDPPPPVAPVGEASPGTANEWLRLNVGGTVYATTRTTLRSVPGTFLAYLASEGKPLPCTKDDTGAYLIDRDPVYFRPVLNYLRHGKLVIDQGVSIDGVLAEAEFYGLDGLVSLIRARMRQGPEGGASNAGRKNIYRVFAHTEEELTQMMSSLSDGWRFEQLVTVPMTNGYGFSTRQNGHNSEFMVVISKEIADTRPEPSAEYKKSFYIND